jgi:metallo-beta-lactamase family protein
MSSLTFLGAARTVTGSKHLLDTGGHRVLVDCGLFQGYKHLRLKNWSRLPFAANEGAARTQLAAAADSRGLD